MPLLCPKCSSLLVNKRKDTRLTDKLLAAFSRTPFECQVCHHQFHVHEPEGGAMAPAQERRRVFRVPTQIPVRFECGGTAEDGVVTDLSAEGCALDSKRNLRPGLVLRIHLPAGATDTPQGTMSQVATVRAVDGTRTNLKFLAFTEPEKAQLEHTVTQTLSRFKTS